MTFPDTDTLLKADNLTVGYRNGTHEKMVLSRLELSLGRGELVSLLGANGTGKSTLLRTLAGRQRPLAGKVSIEGRDIEKCPSDMLSRLVSIVHTDRTMAGGLTVEELVSLGRHPHTGFFGRLSASDREIVGHSLREVGIGDMGNRFVATLSDGERQKAMIARALAQDTPVIILDEPTAFLDVASRIEAMQLLARLAHDNGKGILLSSHDVSQSLLLSDRLWLLRSDGTMTQGATDALVTDGALDTLFAGRDVRFDPVMRDFRPL